MNDLLFYALLLVLLYYFFYYLSQQKKVNATNLPLKHDKGIQTETTEYESGPDVPDLEAIKKLQKDIQQKERTIIGLNNSYNKLETKKKQEITDLQTKINTITDQLQTLKTHQNQDQKASEKVIDNLLKGIQELDRELC